MWKKRNKRRNRTAKSRMNENAFRKGKLQKVENTGRGHHQISRDERKIRKEFLSRTRKLLENKHSSKNLIKGINT